MCSTSISYYLLLLLYSQQQLAVVVPDLCFCEQRVAAAAAAVLKISSTPQARGENRLKIRISVTAYTDGRTFAVTAWKVRSSSGRKGKFRITLYLWAQRVVEKLVELNWPHGCIRTYYYFSFTSFKKSLDAKKKKKKKKKQILNLEFGFFPFLFSPKLTGHKFSLGRKKLFPFSFPLLQLSHFPLISRTTELNWSIIIGRRKKERRRKGKGMR